MDEYRLDIHGKCRREREELEGKLAEAERELHVLRESESLAEVELGHYKRVVNGSIPDHLMGWHDKQPGDGCLMCQRNALADDNVRLSGKLAEAQRLLDADEMGRIQAGWDAAKDELELLRPVIAAAKAWVAEGGLLTPYVEITSANLRAAVDTLAAEQSGADDPSRVSGRTSGEDGTDVGATANLAVTSRGLAMHAVLSDIIEERFRQDAKWGESNHPDGTGPEVVWAFTGPATYAAECASGQCQHETHESSICWRSILLKQVAQAFAEEVPASLRHELVQVAAVAVAWAEAIDRRADSRAGQAGEEVADA